MLPAVGLAEAVGLPLVAPALAAAILLLFVAVALAEAVGLPLIGLAAAVGLPLDGLAAMGLPLVGLAAVGLPLTGLAAAVGLPLTGLAAVDGLPLVLVGLRPLVGILLRDRLMYPPCRASIGDVSSSVVVGVVLGIFFNLHF